MSDTSVRDPLNADVGDKELTKMPILMPDKIYRLEIRKPTVAAGKKDASKMVMRIPLYTTKDEQSTTGETINAGFPIFHYVTVTPGDKITPQQVAKNIGQVCQAAGVSGVKVSDVIANPEAYLDGKIVDAKVKTSKETDEYGEASTIKTFVPAGN